VKEQDQLKPRLRQLTAVALISAAVLGIELALMRSLSVSRGYHFAYLIVSLALLGFGVSGTCIALVQKRVLPRFSWWIRTLTCILALSIPLCFRLAQLLPLDMAYLLYSGSQQGFLLLFQTLTFLPFLLAGFVIGLSILRFSASVNRVYGASLLGSGLGPLLTIGLLWWLAPERLIQVWSAAVFAATFLWPPLPGSTSRLSKTVLPVAACLVLLDFWQPPAIALDPHKALAQLRQWQLQGNGRFLVTRYGPRARLDVFSSPRLHFTLFAGLTAATPPPAQLLLLGDGDILGPVFRIQSPAGAQILDETPMSVAYRLLAKPRVALLGESTGTSVWLARRFRAAHITVVQPNSQIVDLLNGPLAPYAGSVFQGPDVELSMQMPRHFLKRTSEKFDLIQVVSAEVMAAGLGGLLSLHENYMLTVEGMQDCLRHLTAGGLLSITRGLQSPPRDNIKILATLAAALERLGVRDPGKHLVQLRNHLAVCTMASVQPITASQRQAIEKMSNRLWLDIDLLPGFDPESRLQFNRLTPIPGVKQSVYQFAAENILSEDRERFFRSWPYNVRPATDDRPYFSDFFRWRSLPVLLKTYGPQWLQRLELGYVVLLITLVEIVAAGLGLLILPLFLLQRRNPSTGRGGPALWYFFFIGLAYLGIEMTFMQHCTLMIGDSLLSAAGVLAGFLFFSGCGSISYRYLGISARRAVLFSGAAIAILAPVSFAMSHWLLGTVASWSTAGRFLFTMVLLAPLAFIMGCPFPAGMLLLEQGSPFFVPWAWGINGFASVAAAPLAILLALCLGFSGVLTLAVVCYVLALLAAWTVWLRPPP